MWFCERPWRQPSVKIVKAPVKGSVEILTWKRHKSALGPNSLGSEFLVLTQNTLKVRRNCSTAKTTIVQKGEGNQIRTLLRLFETVHIQMQFQDAAVDTSQLWVFFIVFYLQVLLKPWCKVGHPFFGPKGTNAWCFDLWRLQAHPGPMRPICSGAAACRSTEWHTQIRMDRKPRFSGRTFEIKCCARSSKRDPKKPAGGKRVSWIFRWNSCIGLPGSPSLSHRLWGSWDRNCQTATGSLQEWKSPTLLRGCGISWKVAISLRLWWLSTKPIWASRWEDVGRVLKNISVKSCLTSSMSRVISPGKDWRRRSFGDPCAGQQQRGINPILVQGSRCIGFFFSTVTVR